MNDRDQRSARPQDHLRDSALAALGGVAFLGLLVSIPSAWGFADAGHPIWAGLFLALAAICGGGFRFVSKSGSGKARPAASNRVPLERLLPLPPGTAPETRAILQRETRRLAMQTGGVVTAGAFGMLAWHYALADRAAWSAVAACCAVLGAGLFASSLTPKRMASSAD